MKIFGKRIGDILNLIVGGKPKTIVPKDKEEMKEILNLVNESNAGNEEAKAKLDEKLFVPKEEIIEHNSGEIKAIRREVETATETLASSKSEYKSVQVIEELEKNDNFVVVKENNDVKYFLKGFKADLPFNLVQKFAQLIALSEPILHLIKFWMMNLLNDNPEARRGLYKYLTKQKIIVTTEGYFVVFRRIVSVNKKSTPIKSTTLSDTEKEVVLSFGQKIKKWKKNVRNFEVYKNTTTDQLELTKITQHEKNTAARNLEFIGVLYDCLEGVKITSNETVEPTYTDAHTHSMVIKMNQPVRMSRDKCNTNANTECSFGLHVGTPEYVRKNSSLGDTIVACLVNPMHVISIPYSDAHKMRVCEYFPFMILTDAQLANFDKINISVYEQKYKTIEEAKLKKALEVIDNLTPVEKKQFNTTKTNVTKEDVQKLESDLAKKTQHLDTRKKIALSVLDDDVSKSLDMDEVKRIIKARLS